MSKRWRVPIAFFYLLFFTTAWTVNNGKYAFSSFSYVLIILLSMLCETKTCIVLLFCLFPFQRIFLLSKSFMTLVPIISAIVILKAFIGCSVRKRCEKQLIFCVALTVYSVFVEYIRFMSISSSIKYMLTILLMLVTCEVVDFQLRQICFRFFCFSAFLSTIVGYLFPSVGAYTALYTMKYNIRFQGLMGDPGEFGQIMICGIAMAIALLAMKMRDTIQTVKGNWAVLFATTGFCIMALTFIVMSGTRACLIAIAVIYSIGVYWLLKSKKKWIQIGGIICFIISIFTINVAGNYLFNLLSVAHGGENLLEDNRFSIWSGYLENILENWDVLLLGVGMDSCNAYGQIMGLGNPHNVVIEKTVECGLIGFVLNMGIFYPLFQRKTMGIEVPENLPFYAFLSTLLVYGSDGITIPYILLAFILEKRERRCENESFETIPDGKK